MPKTIHRQFSLQAIVRWFFAVAIVALLLFYIAFQARHLIEGPVITLLDEPGTVQEGRVVTFSGKTENIVNLTLNGRPIFTDNAGNFSETVVLEDGHSIMTLKARDRYGRETQIERQLVHVTRTPFSMVSN
jgi:hypothetical protein